MGLNLTLLTFSLNCFIRFFRNCTWWQILWIQENWQFWIFKEKSYLICLNQRSGYFLGSKSTLLNFSLDLLINCIFLKLYLMTGLMRWSECSRFLRNILYIPQNSVNGTCFCPKSLLLIFSINLFTSYLSEIFKRTSYPRSKTIIKDVKLTDTRTTWYLVLSDVLDVEGILMFCLKWGKRALILYVPCISGSFLFSHFFLVLVKKFFEGMKAWQRSVKIKNNLIFYLPTCLGWEGLSRESTLFNLSLNLFSLIIPNDRN